MSDDIPFEPEIVEAARAIHRAVAAGENHPAAHAWQIADAIERLLERHFPDLAKANALDPQETVEGLFALYDAIHGDTANQPNLDVNATPTAEMG